MNLAVKRQSDVRGVCKNPPQHTYHQPRTHTNTHPPAVSEAQKKINGHLLFKIPMTLYTPQQANWTVGTQSRENISPSVSLMFRCCAVERFGKCGTCSPDRASCHTADKLRW